MSFLAKLQTRGNIFNQGIPVFTGQGDVSGSGSGSGLTTINGNALITSDVTISGNLYSTSDTLYISQTNANTYGFSQDSTGATTLNSAGNAAITFSSGGAPVGVYSANNWNFTGSVTATQDVFAYSDARLKSNIVQVTGALDALQRLSGYIYDMKGSQRRHVGLIAQEVEEVIPELVHTDVYGIKSIAYQNLAGYFVEGFKEILEKLK